MKFAAVISEYNPFHNGHKYQIDMLKKTYDGVVAIMSGSFVQRGEIAVMDKWTRAQAAILSGVDLVIELPVIYALNTAEKFALGGVRLADSMGIIDGLCFGSEHGNIEGFLKTADNLLSEPVEVSKKIKEYINQGVNYPKAREMAYAGIIPEEFLREPNNILGVEYVKALKTINSKITPITLKRKGAGYNQIDYTGKLNSASGIRTIINNNEDSSEYVPHMVYDIYKTAAKFSTDNITSILKYIVTIKGKEYIKNINDVNEGLENRIYAAVREGRNFDEIAAMVKSKRYTMSKIKRVLMSCVLDINKELSNNKPDYIRVLGMNDMGQKMLKEMKKSSKIPIITKSADFSSTIFAKDILATDIVSIVHGEKIGKDYITSPIII